MPARYCTECGNLVTTAFCPSCGAVQPDPAASSHSPNEQPLSNEPTQSWSTSLTPDQEPDHATEPYASQAWHPFEQPSWTSDEQRPTPQGGVPLIPEQPMPFGAPQPATPAPLATPQHFGPGGYSTAASTNPGNSNTGEFMGVSSWQPENRPSTDNRSNKANWILGGLAAAAVVAVLVAIAFIIIKGNSADEIATPDTNTAPITVDATSTAQQPPPTTGAPTPDSSPSAGATPPVVTVTDSVTQASSGAAEATASGTSAGSDTSLSSTEVSPESSAPSSPADNPRGGPDREIACNSGYVVQIASALTDADFEARVAQLRAAGQLPADAAVATTAGSCQIFTTQTNTVVLYAGPFPDKYAACTARLAGAPDSFIKGTTPETASEYVSCLCPAAIDSVPPITTLNQTGVWVGELQRVLANKLKYKIPDLNGLWGTYSQSTIDAVKAFQTDQAIPVTGQVDAATWQKLQAAQC